MHAAIYYSDSDPVSPKFDFSFNGLPYKGNYFKLFFHCSASYYLPCLKYSGLLDIFIIETYSS
jgi:hypothetical protein